MNGRSSKEIKELCIRKVPSEVAEDCLSLICDVSDALPFLTLCTLIRFMVWILM